MSHIAVDSLAVKNWHRLDVCSFEALARTKVSLIGALDMEAVEEIDLVVEIAEHEDFTVVLDLDQVSSVTPRAMNQLLNRGYGPRFTIAA